MRSDRKISGSIRSFRSSFARAALKLAAWELELREVGQEELASEVAAMRDEVLWACVRLDTAMGYQQLTKDSQIQLDVLAANSRALSGSKFDRTTAPHRIKQLAETFNKATDLFCGSKLGTQLIDDISRRGDRGQ